MSACICSGAGIMYRRDPDCPQCNALDPRDAPVMTVDRARALGGEAGIDTGLTIATVIAIARQVSVADAEAYASAAVAETTRLHTIGLIEDPAGVATRDAERVDAIARAFLSLRRAIERAT